jgi:hypothetical protein
VFVNNVQSQGNVFVDNVHRQGNVFVNNVHRQGNVFVDIVQSDGQFNGQAKRGHLDDLLNITQKTID